MLLIDRQLLFAAEALAILLTELVDIREAIVASLGRLRAVAFSRGGQGATAPQPWAWDWPGPLAGTGAGVTNRAGVLACAGLAPGVVAGVKVSAPFWVILLACVSSVAVFVGDRWTDLASGGPAETWSDIG